MSNPTASSLQEGMELLYAKSKVYLHPSSSKRDNVAGYLTLTKPQGANVINKDIVLSFSPEYALSTKELDVYKDVDINGEIVGVSEHLQSMSVGDTSSRRKAWKPPVVPKPSTSLDGSGAFSISLSSIYSIQFRTPSLGWWYGSIIVYSKHHEKLPVLFFHDDESPSTIRKQKLKSRSFDPFGEDGTMYWGGQDFLNVLQGLIAVDRSTVEPSVFLIDPLHADLVNFSPFGEEKSEEKKESSKKVEPFVLPNINKMVATAKWKVLEAVATIGSRTKNQVVDLIDDHVPQLVTRSIMSKPEVQKINNDFESARVYLAKWAAQVREEAEQSQRAFMLEEAVYARINKELGNDSQLLTPQEMSLASRRKPINLVEWNGFFDHEGRLIHTVDEVKSRIFHGGLEKDVRKEAWPFLLGVYGWETSKSERKATKDNLLSSYADFKRRWADDEVKKGTEFWKDQKVRIEKDIHRNDRHLDIFKDKKKRTSPASKDITHDDNANIRESSPETPDEESEWDLSIIENIHLFRMREILLTFNEYNVYLGYVQGMTDLLSPIYVVFQDEVMSFWAFVGFMERMERNFVRDQSGMKRQMLVLNELVQFMLPDLFHHLEKCESTDLFFFFRMLLVWFKREFPWGEVNTLWEVLWTDYYSSQYHLFVALAILSDNERIMKQNLRRFDEVLKYMNDLSGKMKLHDLLIRSELLFLRFRRMIELIDREAAQNTDSDQSQNVRVNPHLRELLSRKIVVQKEVERPEGVGGG